MNMLDLNQDVQKLILDYLPGKDKASFVNSSKTSLRIAETVDESFKDKVTGRAAIKSLKNWTFAKIVLGAILFLSTIPLIVVATVTFSIVGLFFFLFGGGNVSNDHIYELSKLLYSRAIEGLRMGSMLGLNIGSLGSFRFLMNSIDNLENIKCVENTFNTKMEERLNLTKSEEQLFPKGLDFKRQRINKCNDAVESKLKNPARGTFSFMRNNQEIIFDAAYCFDNYYGPKNSSFYKRILKVAAGVDSTGNKIDGNIFFGDDKHSVYAVKNKEGVLVLEMKRVLYDRNDIYNEKQFIELHLNS